MTNSSVYKHIVNIYPYVFTSPSGVPKAQPNQIQTSSIPVIPANRDLIGFDDSFKRGRSVMYLGNLLVLRGFHAEYK